MLLLPACLLLSAVLPLSAQNEPAPGDKPESTESNGPNGFWQATMPGGSYMVALNRITSVSRHKYLLDGALIVDEVTIDTVGQSLARFYFIMPVTQNAPGAAGKVLSDRAAELMERAGQANSEGLENMVVKKYPETTHARTVEYRLLSKDQLTSLYDSVRKAWENNRGSKLQVK